MALVPLVRLLSSSNSELLFAILAPIPLRSWFFGYKFRRIRDSLCLAGCLSFVDVLLQPVFAGLRFVVTVDGGASAFVSDGPAPAARSQSRRILAVAPMAHHDWPSILLPHGFVSDVSLRATLRWAENCV